MEFLPHDVIEYHILERLDVETLLRFKSVSKQWNSTIQSPNFKKRQLIYHRRQSRQDPYVLLVSVHDGSAHNSVYEALRTLPVDSSSSSSVSAQIPTCWENKLYQVCNTSCDGLICLYDFDDMPSIVVNPATRWHRTFPPCNYQLVAAERSKRYAEKIKRGEEDDDAYNYPIPSPGFGKDKINGTYKSVWLYNSAKLGVNNNTSTCEVFDFATNSWRYLVPASPCLILHTQAPVYLDGSLYWFTASSDDGEYSNDGETMVLSLDLHTETFQIIAKAPFLHASDLKINMSNLNDRLCVSEEKGLNQVIWSFDSHHKTWNQIYSIDLTIAFSLCGRPMLALVPLAVLDKDKLLFYSREFGDAFVTHDPITKSYVLAAQTPNRDAYAVYYFPSLISIL
ncbi:unnamed protein product [Microthlaspi erraticum]|uniref:F-box domain-containing protein n=1 Tax=Microthlaspi erraticum TaxID=1685480 RepID=A0A6D2ING8_9BRAS|nr:unnamed protein product [Microthlaspi erraticum]